MWLKMSDSFRSHLQEMLNSPEFARSYGENIAKAGLAVVISRARREAGLTQQELAAKIGKSQSYIARLESGDANPTAGTVGRILAELGMKLAAGFDALDVPIKAEDKRSVETVDENPEKKKNPALMVREPRPSRDD